MGLPAAAAVALPGGGTRPAGDLRVGAAVQSQTGAGIVAETAPLPEHAPLLEVVTGEGSVVLTGDHLILCNGLWRWAGHLRPGDRLSAMRDEWPARPRPPRHGWRSAWRRRVHPERSGTPCDLVAVEAVRTWPGTDPVLSIAVEAEHCLWAGGFLVKA
jgi:hypothetical protein